MTRPTQDMHDDARRDEAVTWHVRLQSDQAGEADWLAFEAWLGQPGAREAYDAIDGVWAELDLHHDALAEALREPAPMSAPPARAPLRRAGAVRGRPSRRLWFGALGAAAAAAAAAVAVVSILPAVTQPHWTTYSAEKGHNRAIRLADGSSVTLGAGSTLKVSLDGANRRVVMDNAEAVFDVAKDPSHPFLIQAGDHQVRVVGTRFDVLRANGRVVVTVERGIVQVRRTAAGEDQTPAELHAGQQFQRRGSETAVVRTVDPREAMAWREGRLIYRDAELGDVVADLNRYYDKPLRVSPDAARLHFSGVLALDGEDQVVRRLELLMPVRGAAGDGALILQRRPGA
ncbi:MAG: FecR domain-containing protein [Proteobacteria bacterium]|nr:FecR domain-containing protein [Pseudomonadota bacterium]